MFTALPKRGWGALVVLAIAATSASAQQTTRTETSYGPPPYYGYGGGGGYGGYGRYGWGMSGGIGSTAAGSYLGGMGMAIRAQGQYNLMTSEAAINLQEAAKQQMENQKLWTETYFEKRRINKAARDAEKGPKLTKEDWVRMAHEAAPKRLENGIDQVTGEIEWPTALQTDSFAQDRETLDQLFAERAHAEGAIGIDTHGKIRSAVDAALAALKSHIRDINTRHYLAARNFLKGLAREADFPTS